MALLVLPGRPRGLRDRLSHFSWPLLMLISVIAAVGVVTLLSVADGSWSPWAFKHLTRYLIALGLCVAVGLINVRIWMALAYPIYFFALLSLALVPVIGVSALGAQRWLEIGGVQFQPSAVMKIGLLMGLARYYHGLRAEQVSHILYLIPPLLMIGAPAALILHEPDLGTAILVSGAGVVVMVLAGLSWRLVGLGAAGVVAAGYTAYRFALLKPYQVERILTFLNPDRDPLGTGYHLLQSKIGLGSGGFVGKGYLQGSQSQLKFLPELQTDFIFTVYGEQFGFIGCITLLALYAAVILLAFRLAIASKSHFGRLVGMGVTVMFSLYVMINTSMVMGLAPVVGVPLPLLSYGGTMQFTIMIGFGLLMSAYASREQDAISLR